MMRPKPLPTRDELLALFDYDAASGALRWKRRDVWNPSVNGQRAGKLAGKPDSKGYIIVTIDTKAYKLHRLIWKIENGIDPFIIDHIDNDPSNNRISNLREANYSLNRANSKPKNRLKGIHRLRCNGRYQASIFKDGKAHHLGTYETAEEAHLAYCEAAKRLFGEFARTHGGPNDAA